MSYRVPTQATSSARRAAPAPAKSSPVAKRAPRCLFDVLNHTKTAAGARLLRASLLQPFSDRPSITARLDAVEELRGRHTVLSSMSSLLADLNQFDSVLMQALVRQHTLVSSAEPTQARCAVLSHLLHMRRWADTMAELTRLLEPSETALLRGVKKRLGG